MECIWEQIGEVEVQHVYKCINCKYPKIKSTLPPERVHRNCGNPMRPERETTNAEWNPPMLEQKWFRNEMIAEATDDMVDVVNKTLDHCFGKCKHFNGWTCVKWFHSCTMLSRWYEVLQVFGCNVAGTQVVSPLTRKARPKWLPPI